MNLFRVSVFISILFSFHNTHSAESKYDPLIKKDTLLPLVILDNSKFSLYDIGTITGDTQKWYVLTDYVNKSMFESGSDNKITIGKYSCPNKAKKEMYDMSSDNEFEEFGNAERGGRKFLHEDMAIIYLWVGDQYYEVVGKYESLKTNIDLKYHLKE